MTEFSFLITMAMLALASVVAFSILLTKESWRWHR